MAKKNATPKAKTLVDEVRNRLAKAPKLPRTATTLVDEVGNRLTIVAQELKNGSFRSAVLHRVDGKTTRGMIDAGHGSFELAERAQAALVGKAIQQGWAKKERKAKKPAFTSIPVPASKPTPIRKSA